MMRHIVVGVDGSSASREAARWAVDHARLTGAELEAVHAWSAPDLRTDRIAGAATSSDRLQREARRELREVIDQLDERGLVAPITEHVACGEPAAMLLEACRDADLLVVGRRGLNGDDDGAHLRRLIREAKCPVVVVPA
jgi:nucleotide-binding universal stress UspA family protein